MSSCSGLWHKLRQVKARSYILLIALVSIATLAVLWRAPRPYIRRFVSHTQKKLNNFGLNVHDRVEKVLNEPAFQSQWDYLSILGFTKDSESLNKTAESNDDLLPVLVTAVNGKSMKHVSDLVRSLRHFLPQLSIIVYGLELDEKEQLQLQLLCNKTHHCERRAFDYSKFPRHIKDHKLGVFKPIIIQMLLTEIGAVFWVDATEELKRKPNASLFQLAKKQGVVGWRINNPVSAWTYYKVYHFFQTQKESFYFQHMIETEHLLVYRRPVVHTRVMLPWLQCCLTSDCVNPRGAQDKGCNYQRKPRMQYSGCHAYATSVLNVVLGLAYESDELYTAPRSLFRSQLEYEALLANHSSREWRLIR